MPDATPAAVYADAAVSDEKYTGSEDNDGGTKSSVPLHGLDELAIFAGLFSIVITAFILEAREDMQPDYTKMTFIVLNATAFGTEIVEPLFVVRSEARVVHCLWVTSLLLSLSAAFVAIRAKGKLVLCSSSPPCGSREWVKMPLYKFLFFKSMHTAQVRLIDAAPVLLHASMLLFCIGLVLFMSTDAVTQLLTLGTCMAGGAIYTVTASSHMIVSSISWYRCQATRMLDYSRAPLLGYMRIVVDWPNRGLVRTLLGPINAMLFPAMDEAVTLPMHSRPGLQHQRSARRSLAMAMSAAGRTLVALAHSAGPSTLRTALRRIGRSSIKAGFQEDRSANPSCQTGESFTSAASANFSVDRLPELVAESLLSHDDAVQSASAPETQSFTDEDREPRAHLHRERTDLVKAPEQLPAFATATERIESVEGSLQVAMERLAMDIVLPQQRPIKGGGGNVLQGFGHINGVREDFAVKVSRGAQVMPRECEIWKSLSHENVLPLCCAVEFHAAWLPGAMERVFVSPYLPQGNLADYLKANPLAPRLPLMIDVANGLAYLHDTKKVVHGDIKAENILIGENGRAVLADFGLSTFVAAGHIETAEDVRRRSTVLYCAPEIVDDEARDPSTPKFKRSKTTLSDIYAYGVLLYYTYGGDLGEKPSDRIKLMGDMFKGILPPRPTARFPVLCDDLWSICKRCWAIEPSKRPPIADVLANLRELELSSGRGDELTSEP